jgi:hypothetical protein
VGVLHPGPLGPRRLPSQVAIVLDGESAVPVESREAHRRPCDPPPGRDRGPSEQCLSRSGGRRPALSSSSVGRPVTGSRGATGCGNRRNGPVAGVSMTTRWRGWSGVRRPDESRLVTHARRYGPAGLRRYRWTYLRTYGPTDLRTDGPPYRPVPVQPSPTSRRSWPDRMTTSPRIPMDSGVMSRPV